MSVYEPLTQFLKSYDGNVWDASFTEIERINRRALPRSAHEHRPWWANQKGGNHSQAKAWQDAGFETTDVNLSRKTVRFQRKDWLPEGDKSRSDSSILSKPNEALTLRERARLLTGIDDKDQLDEMAYNALIERESASYLASLGGSQPDAKAPPRRRFPWQS